MKGGLAARLLRGALGVGGLKLLLLPLTVVTSIVLARGLGPEGYGQYSFIMAVITIMALPIGSGLGQLVTREVAKYHREGEWGLLRGLLHRSHLWIFLVSGTIGAMILLLATWKALWTVNDRWTLLLFAILLLPLLGLNSLRGAVLRGLRHVFYAQLPELSVRPGLHLMIVSGLVVFGLLNPASALVSQIAAAAVSLALGIWLLGKKKPVELRQSSAIYRQAEWGRALVPFTLLAAVSNLNGQIGILLLGWQGSNEDVAALRVAMSGAILVKLSLSIINMVIGPHITQLYQNGDMLRLKHLSRQSARAGLAVALPFAIMFIFFGEPIIQLLYGDAYRLTATIPLAILAGGQFVNVAFGSVGLFLTMCGYERDTLAGQIIALIVSVSAAIILVPPLGATGAALSVVLGLTVWNLVLAARFRHRLGFRPSAL